MLAVSGRGLEMSHAIILTLAAAGKKIHIVEAFISGVPHDVKTREIVETLRNSQHQGAFTEHGVFMANRRIVTAGRIPEDANSDNAISIDWDSVANAGSVQFNVRIPAADKARY